MIHITKPKVASKAPEPRGQAGAPISLTLTPAAEQPARPQGKKKGSTPKAEDSDTDPEAPVAQQMLSFVMDDPDFESEASDTPKIAKVKLNRFFIAADSCQLSSQFFLRPRASNGIVGIESLVLLNILIAVLSHCLLRILNFSVSVSIGKIEPFSHVIFDCPFLPRMHFQSEMSFCLTSLMMTRS